MNANVSKLPPPRRRRTPEGRSHDEIYDLVEQASKNAELASKLAADAVSRADLSHLVSQRVEGKVDKLVKAVGEESEDERGNRVGTGLVGRHMRLETKIGKRFALYDGWTKMVIGFTTAAVMFGGIIWWLTASHLATVFGVGK